MSGPACFSCKKTVSKAEAVWGLGHWYHELCFTCFRCPNTLKKFYEYNNHAYCERCFAQYHSAVWNSNRVSPKYIQKKEEHTVKKEATVTVKSTMTCTYCQKPIATGQYFTPPNKAGKVPSYFHQGCFRCSKCSADLGSGYNIQNKKYVCMNCFVDKAQVKHEKEMEKYRKKMEKYEKKKEKVENQ